MGRYHNLSKNLRTRPDIDMSLQHRDASASSGSKGNLLEYEAIDADLRLGVDYYSVRVRYCQAASDAAVDWDIRSRHHAPKAMFEHVKLAAQRRRQPRASRAALIAANGLEKLLSRLPEARSRFAGPVRLCRGDPCITCELIHREIV